MDLMDVYLPWSRVIRGRFCSWRQVWPDSCQFDILHHWVLGVLMTQHSTYAGHHLTCRKYFDCQKYLAVFQSPTSYTWISRSSCGCGTSLKGHLVQRDCLHTWPPSTWTSHTVGQVARRRATCRWGGTVGWVWPGRQGAGHTRGHAHTILQTVVTVTVAHPGHRVRGAALPLDSAPLAVAATHPPRMWQCGLKYFWNQILKCFYNDTWKRKALFLRSSFAAFNTIIITFDLNICY